MNQPMEDFEGFRLSPQQQLIWEAQQQSTDVPRVLGSIQITGVVDVQALKQALENVVGQYEILRTTFQCLPTMALPLQVVSPTARILWSIDRDCSTSAPEEQEQYIDAVWREMRQEVFDTSEGPVLHASLVKCAQQKYLLLLGIASLCADAYTIGILAEALSQAYGGQTAYAEFTDEILQYADFAEWQHELLISSETAVGREYWQDKQLDMLPVPVLPFEHRHLSPTASTFGVLNSRLLLSTAIQSFCHRHNSSLATFLLTCWHILLHKYTLKNTVLVATAFHGRTYEELQKSPGPVTRYIPVQSEIRPGQTFRMLAEQLQQTEREISEWQEYFAYSLLPFNLKMDKPQKTVPFGFEFNEVAENWFMREASFSLVREEAFSEPFTLRLECAASQEQEIHLAFHYNTSLLEEQDVRCIAEQLHVLIERASQDSEAAIGLLSFLGPDEKQRLINYGTHRQAQYPGDVCLHQLFSVQAARTPDAPAVAFGKRQLTYHELDQQTNQLAHYLRRIGVGPDVLVGIYMGRSLEMVVGLLAVLKAGGAYVPLDPTYPLDRLHFMIEDAHAQIVLTQHHLQAQLVGKDCTSVCLDTDWESCIAPEAQTPLAHITRSDNLAYSIYTSGSTGRPKGVMISHRSLCNHMFWMLEQFPLTAHDRILQKTPFSFDASVWEFYAPLLSGALLVMAQPEGHQDASYIIQAITDFHITILQVVPSFLRILLETPGFATCASLRILYCGGERLPLDLVEQFTAALPTTHLCNLYGPTETTIQVTFWVCTPSDTRRSVPIGRPITNVQVYILDENFEIAAAGLPGVLYIGGEGTARGYWRRPDLTADRFVPNPFAKNAGERLYNTGDLARYLPGGTIEFLGRSDHQAKVRGFRIELGEIEALLRTHPLINECVVVVREDEHSNQRLVAYIVPSSAVEEQQISGELRRHLQRSLSEYMVPSAFHILAKLPLTPNGKIDRNALPDLIAARPELAIGYEMPSTEFERIIAQVWQDLLKVDRVGLHDNFFDLGGHSLLLIQVQQRLRTLLQINISLVELFTYPTISRLTHFLASSNEYQEGARTLAPAMQKRLALRKQDSGKHDEVAIIGMVGRFPKASDIDTFWQNLCEGVDAITFATTEELRAIGLTEEELSDPNLIRAGGVLEDVDYFDASFFGYSPREAAVMDPQHRLFLECAWHALEHAGYNSDDYPGLIGLYAGASVNDYGSLLEDVDGLQALVGTAFDFLPTRIAYKLNLRGPCLDVQTACSTSLVAVHLASQSLLHGECDIALAGGVSARFPQNAYLYSEGGIESRDGYCRTFDAHAQGAVSGNGIGIVVLKRLSDALADGDSIYAVIKGTAVNNDGSARAGYTAPGVLGQVAVIREALEVANVSPENISYIEAHGSGTPLGDPIEIAAITQAFRAYTVEKEFCAIGSVKTNIGHLDRAAGIAGLIKTILSLQHHILPPSLHFEQPNPQIDFVNSPFYVNTKLTEWHGDKPRIAGVSAFGLGGTNAHVIVAEAPEPVPSRVVRSSHLIVLSAHTPVALDTITHNFHQFLQDNPAVQLANAAYTLQVGRKHLQYRRMLICSSEQDAIQQLAVPDSARVCTGNQEVRTRSLVFMFPGIGDQYPNMSQQLYETEPLFKHTIDRCAEILNPLLGLDVREILYTAREGAENGGLAPSHNMRVLASHQKTGPNVAVQQLQQTQILQPLLFMVEYALARLWMEWGMTPQALIGHSLGEYTSACIAGVLSLDDALTLVTRRAQLIQTLPESAMLAVPLSEQDIVPLLNEKCSLSAINGPNLSVISGSLEAIEELETLLRARNVVYQRLQSGHAFHSRMLEAIVEPFHELVSTFTLNSPDIPYISTLTGKWITETEATDPAYWVRQLCKPVRFVEGLHELLQEKNLVLLEVGPGQSLGTFVRQHPDVSQEHLIFSSLGSPYERQPENISVLNTLGKLWLSGLSINWAALHSHERLYRIALPLYPFERQRYWFKPYKAQQNENRTVAHPGKHELIENWFYTPTWTCSQFFSSEQIQLLTARKATWILFADAHGLGDQVAEHLKQREQEVILLRVGKTFSKQSHSEYVLCPGSRTDYDLLLQELLAAGSSPEYILHFWCIGDNELQQSSAELFDYWQSRGYYSLLFFVQALEKHAVVLPYQQREQQIQLAVIANQLYDVTEREAISPEKTTVMAACKVIQQEYQAIACHCIDVVLPRRTAQKISLGNQVLAEVLSQTRDLAVAYRGNQRWVQVFEKYPLSEHVQKIRPLRQGGVYLITGGLGGFGLLLAEDLARSVQARLVLVSRTGLPPRHTWQQYLDTHQVENKISKQIQKVQHIESLGSEVLILQADVTDKKQMQKVLAYTNEQFAVLHGVIHAVGAPAGTGIGPIGEIMAAEDLAALFHSKVHSLPVLADVLEDIPLDFCILFSSNASILGGLGFIAYAAANQYIDAFAAHSSKEHDVPWISTNWDSWSAEEDQPGSAESSMDQYKMTQSEFVTAFERIAQLAMTPQVVVSAGDLQTRLDLWVKLKTHQGQTQREYQAQAVRYPRPHLLTRYEGPRNETESKLCAIWQLALGIEEIGIFDNFFELGGHSLLALQIMNQLREAFRLNLPLQTVVEVPTVAQLAEAIVRKQAEQVDEMFLAQVLSEVEAMSDDELRIALINDGQESAHE